MDFYLTTSASTLPRFQITWMYAAQQHNVEKPKKCSPEYVAHTTYRYSGAYVVLQIVKGF